MSRSNYSDDLGDEFPGQMGLYRANVERSIRSKAGQARLRELRDALVAMSVKELQKATFARGAAEKPEVCALGAWAVQHCGIEKARWMVPRDGDAMDTADALQAHGWPKLVVWEAVYMNDEAWSFHGNTPSGRYERMLKWVNERIVNAKAAPHGE